MDSIPEEKTTGHTPGPWRVSGARQRARNHDNALIVHGDEDTLDPMIATVWGDCTEEEAKRNAVLIAAAPDLLAALVALCAWHDHSALTGLKHGSFVASWSPSFDETVRLIERTVKAVTGRPIKEVAVDPPAQIVAAFPDKHPPKNAKKIKGRSKEPTP